MDHHEVEVRVELDRELDLESEYFGGADKDAAGVIVHGGGHGEKSGRIRFLEMRIAIIGCCRKEMEAWT